MAPGWWQDSAADRVLSERPAPARFSYCIGLPLGHRVILRQYQPGESAQSPAIPPPGRGCRAL